MQLELPWGPAPRRAWSAWARVREAKCLRRRTQKWPLRGAGDVGGLPRRRLRHSAAEAERNRGKSRRGGREGRREEERAGGSERGKGRSEREEKNRRRTG
eukprot:6200441-Pleurochrysis_carterae.AAC.2